MLYDHRDVRHNMVYMARLVLYCRLVLGPGRQWSVGEARCQYVTVSGFCVGARGICHGHPWVYLREAVGVHIAPHDVTRHLAKSLAVAGGISRGITCWFLWAFPRALAGSPQTS